MPPTPPPRRVVLRGGDNTPTDLTPDVPVSNNNNNNVNSTLETGTPTCTETPNFTRIASGLKIAQAQAMAVAGFLPETVDALVLQPHANKILGKHHGICSYLNHRASFHGKGLLSLFLSIYFQC